MKKRIRSSSQDQENDVSREVQKGRGERSPERKTLGLQGGEGKKKCFLAIRPEPR